jgi:diguanylate cyclase (GGDEF)-like protein
MIHASSQKLLNIAFSEIEDPLFVMDLQLRVVSCNFAAEIRIRENRRDIIGRDWLELVCCPDPEDARSQLELAIAGQIEWQARIPILDPNTDSAFLFDTRCYPLKTEDDGLYYVVHMREVTEEVMAYLQLVDRNSELQILKENYAQQTGELNEAKLRLEENFSNLQEENHRLSGIAVMDMMTGLSNYRAFCERLHQETEKAILSSSPLSMLLFDVDNFKQYNDQYGHPQGDELLRRISAIVRENMRCTDFPARYGGEEFAVLFPGVDKFGAVAAAERLRSAIEAYHMPNRSITISVGVAEYPADTRRADDLVSQADKAMYTAKSYGKNTTCFWSHDAIGAAWRYGDRCIAPDMGDCVSVSGANPSRFAENKKILIVDKDDMLLSTLRDGLQERGYGVAIASSGRLALAKLADGVGAFDLIVTDIALPDRTGYDLIEQARAIQPGVPVAFLTSVSISSGNSDDGALPVSILTKPVRISDILGVIRKISNNSFAEPFAA